MRRGRRRGAAAVEFALVTPLLTIITMGIVEYSWCYTQRAWELTAARSAVRAAVREDVDPVATAEAHAWLALREHGIDCAVIPSPGCRIEAERTTVGSYEILSLEIEVPYTPIATMVPAPSSIEVSFAMMLESSP